MASRIKLNTLQEKVEYIVLKLGGKPDEEIEENKQSIDEFERTFALVNKQLHMCKEKLEERQTKIEQFGYKSSERVVLDESIKNIFTESDRQIAHLRAVFKTYQDKNKNKVDRKELENREKSITLLRKN